MALHSIVYVSTGVRPLNETQLVELLTVSRARNERATITGLLLYSGGRFIQCIEGPELPTKLLFADIRADARHTDVQQLLGEGIEECGFGSWTMAYLPLSTSAFDVLLAATWPLKQSEPAVPHHARGKQLLYGMWRRMQALKVAAHQH